MTTGPVVVYNPLNLPGFWVATSCSNLPWSIPATVVINEASTYYFAAGAGGTFGANTITLTDTWGLDALTLSIDNPSFTAVVVRMFFLTPLTSQVLDRKCRERRRLWCYWDFLQVSRHSTSFFIKRSKR